MSVEFDVCRDLSEPDGYYTTVLRSLQLLGLELRLGLGLGLGLGLELELGLGLG